MCRILFFFLIMLNQISYGQILESINSLENGYTVKLKFESYIPDVKYFWMENPVRIILDIKDVEVSQKSIFPKMENQDGFVKSILTYSDESRKKTRVVMYLEDKKDYELMEEGNEITIKWPGKAAKHEESKKEKERNEINKVYFKKDENLSQIVFDFKNEEISYDIKNSENTIEIMFDDIIVDEKEIQKTPFINQDVREMKFEKIGNYSKFSIFTTEEKQILATVNDSRLIITFSEKMNNESAKTNNLPYHGEKISLNFQNVEVRSIIQVLADFSKINMVASDSVNGSISLRLNDVPWDQAFDLILKIKNLGKKQEGNVIMIAPAEEMSSKELSQLSANQQIEDLMPLESELLTIRYAKAIEIANILKDENTSLMSARGKISVDPRTNTLLVHETSHRLEKIKELVKNLDKPVKQVLIETHIVKANDNFEKALGVQFGITGRTRRHNTNQLGIGSKLSTSSSLANTSDPIDINVSDRINVSLAKTLAAGASAGSGTLALTLARLPGDTLVDLELSALESEGLAEIVSSPRLLTTDQRKAHIESGEEIPYNETTSSGAAALAFKKAVLKLEVTPQITPDDHIILDLMVTQDSRGTEVTGGVAIDKQELETQVLVKDGETIVLGGIYKQTRSNQIVKVPVLGDLPWLGRLFRNKRHLDQREELLIFVTPRIVQVESEQTYEPAKLKYLNLEKLPERR